MAEYEVLHRFQAIATGVWMEPGYHLMVTMHNPTRSRSTVEVAAPGRPTWIEDVYNIDLCGECRSVNVPYPTSPSMRPGYAQFPPISSNSPTPTPSVSPAAHRATQNHAWWLNPIGLQPAVNHINKIVVSLGSSLPPKDIIEQVLETIALHVMTYGFQPKNIITGGIEFDEIRKALGAKGGIVNGVGSLSVSGIPVTWIPGLRGIHTEMSPTIKGFLEAFDADFNGQPKRKVCECASNSDRHSHWCPLLSQ